jgi:Ras-related GTP-binding protein C/D
MIFIFCQVVQKLVVQLPALNSLMDSLIAWYVTVLIIDICNFRFSSSVDKTFLVDVATKIYIATDSNPVDVRNYELCSDLVDVVLDVSNIYGSSAAAAAAARNPSSEYIRAPVFDEKSLSAIRLNTGMVLYLREVGKCLALICVVHEDHFAKRSLLDYNIDVFRETLKNLLKI